MGSVSVTDTHQQRPNHSQWRNIGCTRIVHRDVLDCFVSGHLPAVVRGPDNFKIDAGYSATRSGKAQGYVHRSDRYRTRTLRKWCRGRIYETRIDPIGRSRSYLVFTTLVVRSILLGRLVLQSSSGHSKTTVSELLNVDTDFRRNATDAIFQTGSIGSVPLSGQSSLRDFTSSS